MKKTLTILALALVAAAPAVRARAYDESRMGSHKTEGTRKTETPKDFRHWADKRVDALHSDMKTVGKDIDNYDESTRRSAESKLDGLKERLSKVEGRLDEVGNRNTKDSWKDRKSIRSEIKSIDSEFGDLQRDLKGR